MPGAPNPATAGQNIPGQASPLQLAYLWIKAGGPKSQVATAVAVALAESSGKINASNLNTNGTTDHGLWQVNDANLGAGGVASAYASNITSPLDNAKAAVAVFQSQGWGAWTTYKSDAYKTYYQQGVNAANVATASTANQIEGALIPLLAIGAGAALPEAAAGEAAAGETAAAGTAAGYGSKALQDLSSLAKAGGIAALLVDPGFLLRMLKIIGGAVLILFGLHQLANAGGANLPGPGRLAKAAV